MKLACLWKKKEKEKEKEIVIKIIILNPELSKELEREDNTTLCRSEEEFNFHTGREKMTHCVSELETVEEENNGDWTRGTIRLPIFSIFTGNLPPIS